MKGVLPSQGADPIPVGKIPDDGTQVAASANADNTTTVIHTVTAGKTLYLNGVTIMANNSAGVVSSAYIVVRNAADAEQYHIFYIRLNDGLEDSDSENFIPPIEIAAGWDIALRSASADMYTRGFIHGYEV